MSRYAQFCASLLLLLAACCGITPAQERPTGNPEIDWGRADARARTFAAKFARELKDAGSFDGLVETYFSPGMLADYLKVVRGQEGGPPYRGCRVSTAVAANVPDSMLRRKFVADLDLEYLEALYLFASRPWHEQTVASDFDLHDELPKKLVTAEKSMDFFRFAPAERHCAVEELQTPGQLEQSVDETESAAGLLRAALPPDLWKKPEFRRQMKAAEKERLETLTHYSNEKGLRFEVPLNALLKVSLLEQEERMRVAEIRIAPVELFVRRKAAPALERAGALADRFLARLHQELDLSKPMDQFMVRDYLGRLRARDAVPFFVGFTMNSDFQPEMTDEEVRQAMLASGNFLYLLLLQSSQAMTPENADTDLEDISRLLPPEVWAEGRKNATVSFLFKRPGEPEGSTPDVHNREELRKFLDDLDGINTVLRRELPEDVFASPGYQLAMGNFRKEAKDEVMMKDLGPEFSDAVQVLVVHREFFEFQIIEEDGEMRIWKVDFQ